MFNYLKKIYILFGRGKKRYSLLLFSLFLIVSLFELISVGLIYPFLSILIDFDSFYLQYKEYLDILSLESQTQVVSFFGLLLIAIYVFKFFLLLYVNWWKLKIVYRRNASLKSSLMKRYMSMSYKDYIAEDSSRFIHTASGAVDKYGQVLESCFNFLSNLFMLLGIISILIYLNGFYLIAAGVVVVSLVYLFDTFFKNKLKDFSQGNFSSSVDLIKGVSQGVGGLKEIRILGKEAFFIDEVEKNAKIYSRYQININLVNLQPKHFYELLLILIFTIAIILSPQLSTSFTDYIPTLGVLLYGVMRLLPSLNIMTTAVALIRYHDYSVSMIYDDYIKLSDKKIENKTSEVKKFESMKLEDISFSYDESTAKQIDQLNFNLHENDSIGIYGKSGSGKTTFIDLLLGLLKPDNGRTFLNSKEINKEEIDIHTKNIFAYIPQDIFIFNGSLKENITLNEESSLVDNRKLDQAIDSSMLREVINELPEGINSNIGERGIKLSGGQKQRVAIARALYHGRQVLIMDEATSALDDKTENEIIEQIRRLKGEMTLIVIAHRLTTLKYCNRIFEIVDGKISGEKSYEDIVA